MKLVTVLLTALAAVFAGCTSETGEIGSSGDADSDTDTDADTDTDTDGDTDSDTDTGTSPPLDPAWFLADSLRIGDADEGCDLDDDDTVDNEFGGLASWMFDEGMIDEHPNDALVANIAGGEFLMVIGLDDIESLVDDGQVSTNLHDGELVDPDAGVPEDLHSGHGSVIVEDPPYTAVDDASIVASHVATPVTDLGITISINSVPESFTLLGGTFAADIDPLPDAQMLDGGLANGVLCGAIDRTDLAAGLAAQLGLDPIGQAALEAFLTGQADINCEDSICQEISIGLTFTAKSVARANP